MTARIEVPFPPQPTHLPGSHLSPPWVPVAPRWEYKTLVRDPESEELPAEADLDALGSEGWELAGVANAGRRVHFYFKRERTR